LNKSKQNKEGDERRNDEFGLYSPFVMSGVIRGVFGDGLRILEGLAGRVAFSGRGKISVLVAK
jgi:hypothetical protein